MIVPTSMPLPNRAVQSIVEKWRSSRRERLLCPALPSMFSRRHREDVTRKMLRRGKWTHWLWATLGEILDRMSGPDGIDDTAHKALADHIDAAPPR